MRAPARALVVAAAASAGCRSWQPPPVAPYFDGELAIAEDVFRKRIETADGDWALMANELATCLEAQGRVGEAWRLYYDAGRAMAVWDTSFGESFGAIVGREETKEYKGDPYEQAFNSIYTGLAFWERGEPDNARASFKEAMLRDADSSDERFKSDLSLSFLLAAWASRDMGLADEMSSFLDEARAARARAVTAGARGGAAPRCFGASLSANVLILASIGRGPRKVAGGPRGELAVIEAVPSRVGAARVTVDGREVGPTEIVADVFFQASTRGGRWMDGLRAGKAVFKELGQAAGVVLINQGLRTRRDSHRTTYLLTGVGSLLLSAMVRPEADIRCWQTLPDTVRALATRLSPGRHRIRVEFLDPSGAALAGYGQDIDVEIAENRTLVLHLRSLPSPSFRRETSIR